MKMDDFTLYSVAIVPLIIGIVQICRSFVAEKYLPLLSLALGIAVGFAYGVPEGWAILQSLLVGTSLGLSASGLYSGVKTVRK